MSLRAGLCSITLRALAADEVLKAAVKAGLEAIEWGGDVHCPPGTDARALAASCRDAGIACPSYGSYFRAGESDPSELPAVLDTAQSLGVQTIRVWGRFGVTAGSPADEKQPVLDGLAHAVEQAGAVGLHVGIEYHGGTLTESLASTLETLDHVEAPLLSYWQPPSDPEADESIDALSALAPHLGHLHVFSWTGPKRDRLRLAETADYWEPVLRHAASLSDPNGLGRTAYLEYVPEDSAESVVREGAFLRETLGRVAAR